MSEARPNPPSSVVRQLRQESGFGCVQCGAPFVEYHHIVPWAEENHFRPEDMVAVCPTCHSMFARLPRERQYDRKKEPHNIREGNAQGVFAYDGSGGVSLGGNIFVGTPYLLAYDGNLLLGYGNTGLENAIYADFIDAAGLSIFKVEWNEFRFSPDNVWDFDFKWNYAIARNKPRDLFFEFDFRKKMGSVCAKFQCGDWSINIQKDQILVSSKEGDVQCSYGFNFFALPPNEVCIHVVSQRYLDSLSGKPCPGYLKFRTTV